MKEMGLFSLFGASDNLGEFDNLNEFDNLRELDKTICKVNFDDFKYFLHSKYGSMSSYYEKIAEYIKEFSDGITNIPYEKILKKYGCSKSALHQVGLDMIEYKKSIYTKKNIPEKAAIQDIKKLLDLLEKRIKGEFGEQEKRSLEENAEKWKKDIVILRTYMEQETEEK